MKNIFTLLVLTFCLMECSAQFIRATGTDSKVVVALNSPSNSSAYMFDSSGNSIWGINPELYQSLGNLMSVTETNDSSFVFAGSYTDTTVPSVGTYLLKVDATGDTIWSRFYRGTGPAEFIKKSYDNGFIITGWPGWIMKTDQFGFVEWKRFYTPIPNSESRIYDIDVMSDSSYIVSGWTYYHPPNDAQVAFLMKIASDGSLLWSADYSIPSIFSNVGQEVEVLNDGFMFSMVTPSTLYIVRTDTAGDIISSYSSDYPANAQTWNSSFKMLSVSDSTLLFYYSDSTQNSSYIFETDLSGNIIFQNEIMFQLERVIKTTTGFIAVGDLNGQIQISYLDSLGRNVSCVSQSNFQLTPATITKNIRIDGTTPGGTITVYFVPRTITAASASADINCNLINKIDQSPAAIDISLYPNPAQNKIYLSTDKSIADRSIEIYSMFGKLIYAGVFHAGQPSISIDLALPDGAYILTLGNVHERISKNFMILH